ncbi:MAG: iron ABC transporter permease [Myxococcota bacterium]
MVCSAVAVPIMAVLASLGTPGDTEWQHIRTVVLPEVVVNTLWLMAQVALYCLIIGVSTAWLTTATSFPGHRFLAATLALPLAMPAYIMAYVYTDLLDYSGPIQTGLRAFFELGPDAALPEIRSLPGAAFVMSLSLYPYVYLLARVAFLQRSMRLFDAARTLGARPRRAFFRVALPSARTSIAGGVSLVLMETLADFGVVEYFGVPTFSTAIFRIWFASGERLAAMKLAAVLFVFVVVLVVLEKWTRSGGQAQGLDVEGSFQPAPLRGWKALVAMATCGAPVLFGCVLPIAMLAKMAVTEGDPLLGSEFLGFAGNSVWVAVCACVVTVLAALILSFARSHGTHWTTIIAIQISTLGYALPGTLLAVGLLPPVLALDRWLAGGLEAQFGMRTGLILTGTVFVLVYAYLTRFLTVAFNTTSSALERIPPAYGHAARSLGATPSKVLRRIQMPLMGRAVWTAMLLVFVDTMRELPATLLLRPFNFETLATRVYRLAADERLAEASSAALTIVLIGLIPVFLLNRRPKAR